MKRIIVLVWVCLISLTPGQAVLKERDLARTLGVLRAELANDYEKQQQFMQMYEQQGAQQHQQLVSYMNQCEQIGLMIYSQNADNTFDMAYACQQAVNLYRSLDERNGKTLPYEKIIKRLKLEIKRYDALIASLKSMPPIEKDNEEALTESDSILLNAIDSLESKMDSLRNVSPGQKAFADSLKREMPEPEEIHDEPLYLTGQQLKDRDACLEYAQTLRDNMQQFLENLEAESTYYKSVQQKVKRLNSFAQGRYKLIQNSIFKEGGSSYFTILSHLPRYIMQAKRAAQTKYAPFHNKRHDYSEWRGIPVLFISLFLIIYLGGALGVTYIVLRWLLPKRWHSKSFKERRRMLNNVVGIALFAILVMIVRASVHRNFIQMSTELIISMAWLLEAIFLSLYIRLKGAQMQKAAIIYTPLMLLSFIVILFRIILIPNSVLNLIYPPVLLLFTLWQLYVVKKNRHALPTLDVIYSHVTTLTMVISCIAAWIGYTLMAVQIMVWWTIQLAAITTITCIYDLMEMYERRHLASKLCPDIKTGKASGQDISAETRSILQKIKDGSYIDKTWFYDFVNRTLVPILAVLSVPISIYWAAGIFEMTSICVKIFITNFIDQKDLIQISLHKLCLVAELWFIFSYINYAIRSFYSLYRRRTAEPDETLNLTLANNVIAILLWGLYAIIAMVILNVPKSGISIVTAGLATGLGFAMQHLIENFFYGLSLMTGRLRVGDYIECDGISGKVESITYQSTQIVTPDGCVISFLNSTLFSNNFKNMTRNHNYELVKIPVGVGYGTNVDEVRRILVEALKPACQGMTSAGVPYISPNQSIVVAFSDFGESSVDLKVCIWMLVEEKINLTAKCKEVIYNVLNENGIEIPFPQRDVHMK